MFFTSGGETEVKNDRTDYYEYDASGNITGIYRYVDGIKTYFYSYEYDEAGQLIREDILEQDKTIIYTYDTGGNIVSKKEYDFASGEEISENTIPDAQHSYTYADILWYDLLVDYEYSENGETEGSVYFDYDLSGNINDIGGCEYTWTAGRQLATSTDGNDFYRYYYNENGFLSEIAICEDEESPTLEKFVYIWDGDKLIARQLVSYDPQDNGLILTSRIIYDSEDEAQGFIVDSQQYGEYQGSMIFLYRKNLQGDITGVVDATSGQLLVEYSYDAYGNVEILSNNDAGTALLGAIFTVYNPLLYRGYAYSILGGSLAYYLGSRFYMPQLGRFLNADKHTDTNTGVVGTNMYDNNNPVVY